MFPCWQSPYWQQPCDLISLSASFISFCFTRHKLRSHPHGNAFVCLDSDSTNFAYRWRHRPTPRPLALDLLTLRCLMTTTTTMADYMLVYCVKSIMDNCICHTSNFPLLLLVVGFSFYCLFVYSAQALCTCSVSSSPFLVNFKHHL